ncbi:MAG: tandem-95 repeat protein, partial [Chrysiogenetes bacterium]|nr:tandem-95 repeat protein [Chrysiogenetes bacterium]
MGKQQNLRIKLIGTILAAVAGMGLVFSCAPAWAQGAPSQSNLWVGQFEGLLQVDGDDASILLSVSDPGNVLAVVVDSVRGIVWAAGRDRLRGYDVAGTLLYDAEVPGHGGSPHRTSGKTLGRNDRRDDGRNDGRDGDRRRDNNGDDVQNLDLDVNPGNGSVWLAESRNLHHFNEYGELLETIALPRNAKAVSFDEFTEYLWAATDKSITAYRDNGSVARTLPVFFFEKVQDIESDDSTGDLWVAIRGVIKRFSATGSLLLVRFVADPDHLSSDGAGNVWFSSGKEILYWDAGGQELASAQPFAVPGGKSGKTYIFGDGYDHHDGHDGHVEGGCESGSNDGPHRSKSPARGGGSGKGGLLFGFPGGNSGGDSGSRQVLALVTNRGDGSVWVASKFEIAHVSAAGETLDELGKDGLGCVKIHDLDLGGGVSAPEIAFVLPDDRAFIGEASPQIEVSYSSEGAAIDPDSLVFELDGTFLPVSCAVLTQDEAQCTPQAPLSSGPASLTATIADVVGNVSEPASISFRVNGAPSILGAPAGNAEEDMVYSFVPAASDPDLAFGDLLTFEIENQPLWTSFDPATGGLSGTPGNNDVGVYEGIVIRVADSFGTEASLPAFSIEVANLNGAPTIGGEPLTVLDEDTTYLFAPSAEDEDLMHGDVLSFEIENQPSWSNFDAVTGALSGTPTNSDVGVYAGIIIRVRDLMGEAAELPAFTIKVQNVNDVPTIAGAPLTVTGEDTPYLFTPSATDEDSIHGDTLRFEAIGLPGWLALDSVTGALSGTPEQVDVGVHGPILLSVFDSQNASASLPQFTIEVLNVNDAPVILAASFTTNEDTPLEASLTAFDQDSDPLTFEIVANGNIGSVTLLDANAGTLRYEPLANEFGSDFLQVRAFDGAVYSETVTVAIEVIAVNDPPTAAALPPIVLDEDTVSAVQILTGTDIESDEPDLKAAVVRAPSNGRLSASRGAAPLSITYTPDTEFSGEDFFKFVIRDPDGASSPVVTATITVNPVNDPPVAAPATIIVEEDAAPLLGQFSSSDPDGPARRYEIVTYPILGTLALLNSFEGVFEFTPAPDASGTDTFVFRIYDEAGGIGEGAGVIFVRPVNDAPVVAGAPPPSVVQGGTYSLTPTLLDDAVEGDSPLTLTIENLPPWASFDEVTGALDGSPGNADVGFYEDITITATDDLGASGVLGPFTIEVINLNDPPVISGEPADMVEVGATYAFVPEADDPDLTHGDVLSFEIAGLPEWAIFDASNGAMTGIPAQSDLGLYENIQLTVVDVAGARASLPAFSISVTGENAAPEIYGIPATTLEAGSEYTFTPIAFDENLASGDYLIFTAENIPSWASLDADTGTLTGTPQNADIGLYQGIVLTVTDSQGEAASLAAFNIEVLEVGAGGGGECSPVANLTYPTRESLSLELTPNESIRDLIVEDINLDGAPDIIVIGETFDEGAGECNPEVEECCLPGDEFCQGPVASSPLSFVSVFTGNLFDGVPDGTFASPVTTIHSGYFLTGEIGDVTDDGVLDLVAADPDVGLYVLAGNGSAASGYFDTGVTIYSDRNPIDVRLLDVDGDGLRDIVALGAGYYYPYGAVEVFLNFGGLDLPLWNVENLIGYPTAFVEGDFNGDPFLDLAVIHDGNYGAVPPGLQVLGGQDPLEYFAGDFFSASTLSIGDYSYGPGVTAGDFTGDGIQDVVYADVGFDGTGFARVLVGAGDGSFTLGNVFDLGAEPAKIQSADLNGDGVLDLVAVNYFGGTGSDGTGTILIGESMGGVASGTFALLEAPSVGVYPGAMGLDDFNADSLTDLVFADNDFNLGPQVSLLTAQACSDGPANTPPGIYGRPAMTAIAESPYLFRPSVSDPDTGDTLEFSAIGVPSWASFDTFTGELSGTPGLTEVGDYGPVTISVSDGNSEPVSLAPFSISVINVLSLSLSGPTVIEQGTSVIITPVLSGVVPGRTLTFSAEKLLSWMNLNTATGEITGTPANEDVDIFFRDFDTLTLADPASRTISINVSDGVTGATSPGLTIVVTNSNDAPVLSGTALTSVTEGPYEFVPALSDPDDELGFPPYADSHVFSVTNLPSWATFDVQTGRIFGILDDAEVGVYSDILVSVVDQAGAASDLGPFTIEVANLNEAPVLEFPEGTFCRYRDANGCTQFAVTAEPGMAFELQQAVTDEDLVHGTETLTFSAMNLPSWAEFSSITGAISGFPLPDDLGTYDNLEFIVTDAAGLSDRIPATGALASFAIIVSAVPVISGAASPEAFEGMPYSFKPLVIDDDGFLDFEVDNLPGWASFDPQTGEVFGIPGIFDLGIYDGIVISVHDGNSPIQSLDPFSIQVLNREDPPTLEFDPGEGIAAREDHPLLFVVPASDPDSFFGDVLTYSLENAPAWLAIDEHGVVRGRPGASDVGEHQGIRVLVQDLVGLSAATEPFTITVYNANDAPVLSGTPASQISVGETYSFQPTSDDSDLLQADVLEFQAMNLPHWLELDAEMGAITGSPGPEDVGVYSDILLVVHDLAGEVAKLPEFDIVVSDPGNLPRVPVGPPLLPGQKHTLFASTQ